MKAETLKFLDTKSWLIKNITKNSHEKKSLENTGNLKCDKIAFFVYIDGLTALNG